MSSINTNLSALTALQSLKATQTAMNKNQNQISTGLRVGEASHNASYWSISTKMKSDNGALGAVKDSIKQSKAMIDTYTSALDKSLKYLDTMKTKLTAGSNPGADLKAIQNEIKASIDGLRSAAKSATFNGQNWLEGSNGTVSLVTSFDAEEGKVNTLDINTSLVNLFNDADAPVPTSGLLSAVSQIDVGRNAQASYVEFNPDATATTLKFTLGGGGTEQTITFAADADLEDVAASINNNDATASLVRATVEKGKLRITSMVTDTALTTATLGAGGTAQTVTGTTGPSGSAAAVDVKNALKQVNDAINEITKGSAMLGANKALLETQEEFIGVLSDSLTAGVSAFVDADMNEVSTRNQALQTQQQLGVQALSMANQNSQMILKLFQ